MKVLVVVTMTNNFGKKGTYNSQEIGLARGLTELGHEVIVYKCVVSEEEEGEEQINPRARIFYIKCNYFGSNGFMSTQLLDKSADILIQFADLQLSVPVLYRWTKKNDVKYIPYVGITWSQSPNKITKMFIEILARRNFKIYKNCGCVAKNISVAEHLKSKGISDIRIAPVCVDLEQVNRDCFNVNRNNLRAKWKVPIDARVILYVGRLEKDKRPIEFIHMLKNLEKTAFAVMIGTGVLLGEVRKEIQRMNLDNQILIIERIPNKEMWQFYLMSDLFVNLNKTEIWGMALLEAMFYQVGIIASDAPGPNCIIEDRKTGFIAKSDDELLELMKIYPYPEKMRLAAFERVTTVFQWKTSAKIFMNHEE